MIGYQNNPFENYRRSSILGATTPNMMQKPRPLFGPTQPDDTSPVGPTTDSPFKPAIPQPIQGSLQTSMQRPRPSPTYPIGGAPGIASNPTGGPLQDTSGGPTRGYDDEIMNLLKPSPGLMAYKNYLAQMPTEDDYKPHVGTRITAALAGLSAGIRDPAAGYKVADDINSGGYKSAMEEYANKTYGLKQTADIEENDRGNQVKILQQARAMGLDYDKLGETRREHDIAAAQKQQEIDTQKYRADAYVKNLSKGKYGTGVPLADGSLLYTNEADPTDTIRVDPRKFGGSGTVGAGQLGINAQNAVSSRIGANASATSAGAAASRAAIEGSRLTWEETRPKESPTPLSQTQASDLAMEDFAADPRYFKYVKMDPTTKRWAPDPNMLKDPGYQVFQQALRLRTRMHLDGTAYDSGGGGGQ